MKKLIFSTILASMFLLGCQTAPEVNSKLQLHFATLEEGQKTIATSDAYTQGLHSFDLQSRLNGTGMEPTEASYLELAKGSVREWTPKEKEYLNMAASIIQQKIDSCGYKIPIPETVTLIKSTMENEGGAGGYTRGTSIYLSSCDKMKPERVKTSLTMLLTHELFHVITRNCPEFREAMYNEIGFELLGREIDLPEVLLENRLSNPDVNHYDNYTIFNIDGKDTPCTLWYYAYKEYEGGSFFRYTKGGVVPLDSEYRPLLKEDGSPIIYDPGEIEGFYDRIGRNTGYIVNPEEALADNFAYALLDRFPRGNPSPDVTARLRAVMKGSWIEK